MDRSVNALATKTEVPIVLTVRAIDDLGSPQQGQNAEHLHKSKYDVGFQEPDCDNKAILTSKSATDLLVKSESGSSFQKW